MASLSTAQLLTSLRWLARLHATFHDGGVGASAAAAAAEAAVVPVGGYWHLGWRRAELPALPPHLDRLASAAPAVTDACKKRRGAQPEGLPLPAP